MRVPPACKVPFLAQNVVIVSIQWTPKDSKAFLKVPIIVNIKLVAVSYFLLLFMRTIVQINSTADNFFLLLQKKLGCGLEKRVLDDSVHKNKPVSTSNASLGKPLEGPGIKNSLAMDAIPHKRHKGL